MNLVMYIFINKDLKLSGGKACAQAGHAVVYSMEISYQDFVKHWKEDFAQTKIVLEAKNEDHIKEIAKCLGEKGVLTKEVHDLGRTEVEAGALTALAVEIVDKETNGEFFKQFSLYK